MNENAHPPGHYAKYPEVTWDLAEERWLGVHDRSDVLVVRCTSCGWSSEGEQVVMKPEERPRIAEIITGSQHWYQCPSGDPAVEFVWFRAESKSVTVELSWGIACNAGGFGGVVTGLHPPRAMKMDLSGLICPRVRHPRPTEI